jgi:hypothetical protein
MGEVMEKRRKNRKKMKFVFAHLIHINTDDQIQAL